MAGFDFHLPQSPRAALGYSRYLHDIPEISEELDFELQPTGRVESQESGIDVVELIANLEDSELDFSEDFSSRFPRPGGPLDDALQDFQLPSSDELFPDDTLPDLDVPERVQHSAEVSPRTSVIHMPNDPIHDPQLDFSFALPRDSINAAALRDFHFRRSDESSFYTSQGTESGHYHYPVQEADHDSVLDEVHDPSQVETKNDEQRVEEDGDQIQRLDQGEEQEERYHQFVQFQNHYDPQDTQQPTQDSLDDQGREGIIIQHHNEDSQESVYSQSVACRLSRDISETSETVCASPRSLQPPDNKAYQDFDWIEGTCYRGSIQPTYKSIFGPSAEQQAEPNAANRKVFSADIAGNRKTWLVLPEAPPAFVCEVTGWRDSRETLCSFYQEYFDDEHSRDNTPISIDAVLDVKELSMVSCEEISIVDTMPEAVTERPITIIGTFTILDEVTAQPIEVEEEISVKRVSSVVLEESATSTGELLILPKITILDQDFVLLPDITNTYGNEISTDYEITPSMKELTSFIHDAAILEESAIVVDDERASIATKPRESATMSAIFNEAALFSSTTAAATTSADNTELYTVAIPVASVTLMVPVVDAPEEEMDDIFTTASPPSSPLAVSSPTPTSPILPSLYLPQRSSSPLLSHPLLHSPPPPPSSPPPPSPPAARLAPPARAPPLPPALPAPPVILTPPSPLPLQQSPTFSSFDALDATQLSQPSPPLSLYSNSSSRLENGSSFPTWLQVLAASLLFLNTWGLLSAFGTFQAYYSVILLTTTSSSSITLIGALSGFLLCVTPLACTLLFRGNTTIPLPIRTLILVGTLLTTLGLFLSSLSTTLWHFLLTQGLCCGLGGGFLFSVAAEILLSTSASFVRQQRHGALALGLATAGAGIGGIIYPLVFRSLLSQFGFAWSVRAIAVVALCTLVVPCVVVWGHRAVSTSRESMTSEHEAKEETPSLAAQRPTPTNTLSVLLKDRAYHTLNLATLLLSTAIFIPYFLIESYAENRGMPLSAYMLPLINFGSLPGLLIPFLLTLNNNLDSIHPLYILACPAGAAALLAFLWTAIPPHATALLAVWCICYGFCVGAGMGLLGVVVGEMTPTPRISATASQATPRTSQTSRATSSPPDSSAASNLRHSITLSFVGLGLLLGGPAAAVLVGKGGSYVPAQVLCGVLLCCGTLTVFMTTTLIPREELERMNRHRNRTKRARSPTLDRKQSSLRGESLREGPAASADGYHGGRDANGPAQRNGNGSGHGAVDVITGDGNRPQQWSGTAAVTATGSDADNDNEKQDVGWEGKPGKEI
jgi:MFS family permease